MKQKGQTIMTILAVGGTVATSIIWAYSLVTPLNEKIETVKVDTATNASNINGLDARLTRIENKLDASLRYQGINPTLYSNQLMASSTR